MTASCSSGHSWLPQCPPAAAGVRGGHPLVWTAGRVEVPLPRRTPHTAACVHCRSRRMRADSRPRASVSPALLRAVAVDTAGIGRPDGTATWRSRKHSGHRSERVRPQRTPLDFGGVRGGHFGSGRRWTAGRRYPVAPCACPAGRGSQGAAAARKPSRRPRDREARCPRQRDDGHTNKAAPLARRPTLGVLRGPRTRIGVLKIW